MKIIHPFKYLAIVTLIFSLILGCETEPLGQTQTLEQRLTVAQAFEAEFTLENFEDISGHINRNIEVNWDYFEIKTYNDKQWYEFKVKQNKPVTYSNKGRIKGQFFTVLAHKGENEIKYFINKMLSFSNGKGYTYFNIEERSYHGMTYLYNLQGEAEYLFHYEKGKPLNSVESIKIEEEEVNSLGLIARAGCTEKANTSRCDSALECALNIDGEGGGSCGGGSAAGGSGWVPITTYHYTDWYNQNGDSSTYNGTTYDGSTTEWVWVPGSGSNNSQISWTYAETAGGGSSNPDGYTSGETTFSENPPDSEEAIPENLTKKYYPNCKSFKFQSVTSLWQAACIKDFEMGVGVYTLNNFQKYRIKIPLLTFETWVTDRFGNHTTAGLAAEISAKALDNTARATVHHFREQSDFTEYDVTKWFEKHLKEEFRKLSDGGRVQRGNPYQITPNKFETGKENCD